MGEKTKEQELQRRPKEFALHVTLLWQPGHTWCAFVPFLLEALLRRTHSENAVILYLLSNTVATTHLCPLVT